MQDQYRPSIPSASRDGSGCVRAVGISCLAVVVVGILVGLWIFVVFSKNPALEGALGRTKLAAECQMNLEQIGGALERYSRKNGRYPEELDDLYPDFLEKRDVLHCPADESPKQNVSYEYKRPAEGAPANAIIIRCERHIIVKDEPPLILILHKDGRVSREGTGALPSRRR